MMKGSPIIISVAFLFLPIYSWAICENSETFTKEVDGVLRYCKWFRFKEFRRQEFCTEQKVRDNCPQACGLCCEDDPDYTFALSQQTNTIVDCAWITKNPSRISVRRKNYCDPSVSYGGRTIRDACPLSCNFCFSEITHFPTMSPSLSMKPSMKPSIIPSLSLVPSPSPSLAPSASKAPSQVPSVYPSLRPSSSPTRPPSPMPSPFPSTSPTLPVPSRTPTNVPSVIPSDRPSSNPSFSGRPSISPTNKPSCNPSLAPTGIPSDSPSMYPSDIPSDIPTLLPSDNPSVIPTGRPSDNPTTNPTQSIKPTSTPSASPSDTPSNLPTTPNPTNRPTSSPTEYCYDIKSFTFDLDFTGEEVDCSWITDNFYKREVRRERYCNRLAIKLNCRYSCDECWCADNPDYRFETLNSYREVDCSWISQNYKNWENRVNNYCGTLENPTEIATNCIYSCKYCSADPSAAPSETPSISTAPTYKPTGEPSVKPTNTPSASPSISSIPSIYPTSNPTTSSKPSNVPSDNPTTNPTVSIKPSASPTSSPSYSPSVSEKPSMIPSSKPTESSKPSRIPTVSPTSSPSTDEPTYHPTITCLDNPDFNFVLDNGNVRDCSWITGNSFNTPIRISEYCPKAHIKSNCKATCKFCVCKNDTEFKFVISTGEKKHCKWISFNPFKTEQRREAYCGTPTNPTEVANKCTFACGFCDKA